MKAEDLRAKSVDELKKELLGLKKEQFNLRFQLSQGQLSNTAQLKSVRRDVARVKTVLAEIKDGADAKATAKKAPAKKTTAKSKKSDKAA